MLTFRSTQIEVTGARTLRVHGDLTLHGVTRPITLDTRFNGGYAGDEVEIIIETEFNGPPWADAPANPAAN